MNYWLANNYNPYSYYSTPSTWQSVPHSYGVQQPVPFVLPRPAVMPALQTLGEDTLKKEAASGVKLTQALTSTVEKEAGELVENVTHMLPLQGRDFYRETAARYLGYFNEAGEGTKGILNRYLSKASMPSLGGLGAALSKTSILGKPLYDKNLANGIYNLTYHVVAAYSLMDALSKGKAAYQHTVSESKLVKAKNAFIEGSSAGLFQAGASYFIPAFYVEKVREFAEHWLKTNRMAQVGFLKNPTVRLFAPAIVSIAVIPLLIAPIDAAVNTFNDKFYKPLLYKLLGKPVYKAIPGQKTAGKE